MIAVDQWLQETNTDARIVMQVHDELVFEVENSVVDQAINKIRQHMATAAELAVPLLVDIGVGNNWDEAH